MAHHLQRSGQPFKKTVVLTPGPSWMENFWILVSKDIHDAIAGSGPDSGLLAASFKNSQQVLELVKYGVKAVTVAPDVIEGLVKNAAIDAAIDQFTRDFRGLVGEGKTMADC